MAIYVGLIPYPNPESQGFELRDNIEFKACLIVLRRGNKMKDRTSTLVADGDGRCFRIFRKEFNHLEFAFGKRFKIGDRITGSWIFVRKGVAFGLIMVRYFSFRKQYVLIPTKGKVIDPYQLTGVRS
jgi:hypothetical protein